MTVPDRTCEECGEERGGYLCEHGGCEGEKTMARKGDWIQTFTGRQFWPLDPRSEEVDIVDIVQALSNQCRFSGHTKWFYSVAEHSVRVHDYVRNEIRDATDMHTLLYALLHDAPEAYLVDLPRPLKHCEGFGEIYRECESRLMRAICHKFRIDTFLVDRELVSRADDILLATEKRDLMHSSEYPWAALPEPLEDHIWPLSPSTANALFVSRFDALTPL